jgi:hypothetical protein
LLAGRLAYLCQLEHPIASALMQFALPCQPPLVLLHGLLQGLHLADQKLLLLLSCVLKRQQRVQQEHTLLLMRHSS